MLQELTVKEFMSTLGSDAPVPGGGSAAALAGATACSLLAMVAGLTMEKKGYEAVWEEMGPLQTAMEENARAFLSEMDRDAASYAKVIECYRLPKDTDEEKTARSRAIQAAILEAATIPMEVAERAAGLFEAAKQLVEKGNQNAASDGAVGALLARTCLRSALYNVRINAVSLKDQEAKGELLERADALERLALREEEAVLSLLSFD